MDAEPRFRASPTIRHAEIDGLRVLLDLPTERYRVLDDSASVLWSILICDTDARTALESFDVDEERLRADLDAFAGRCVEERLLQRVDAVAAPPAFDEPRTRAWERVLPRWVRALACLLETRRALAREGLWATYERCAREPVAARVPDAAAALSSFVAAENLFVARRAPDDCLLRSLALYRFLRRCGVAAEHVIGVRRLPFAAHAWVEAAGSVLLDPGTGGFTPLARLG
jgi:hypothetical protein